MNLTERLQKIVDLVQRPEGIIVDVGTDHGLVPIALAKKFPNRKIYGLDVNKAPLAKAMANAQAYRVGDQVEFKLSDGLQACLGQPLATVIITGMGGILMKRILEEARASLTAATELILSPHSDPCLVRRVLHKLGFSIQAEHYVKEAGKIYLIIYALAGQDDPYREGEYGYGKMQRCQDPDLLVQVRHQALREMETVYGHLLALEPQSPNVTRKIKDLDRQIRELKKLMQAEGD